MGSGYFISRGTSVITSVLSAISASISHSKALRTVVAWVNDWIGGLQYGSYTLKDEAALAASFCDIDPHQEGGVVIDAGASRGMYTKELLLSGKQFRTLLMIEPAPALGGELTALAAQYPFCAFEPVAVGANPGIMDFHYDSEGSGLGSLYLRDIRHGGIALSHSVPVPVTTLDELARKYALQTIDYVKLDLEGHELEALKGASQLLQSHKIKALTFEFGGCNIDSRTYIKDFWNLLVDGYGYSLYRQLPRRRLLRLDHYSESLERFNWQNILACARGVNPSWKILH
jgi:FkbM family methyltransferase